MKVATVLSTIIASAVASNNHEPQMIRIIMDDMIQWVRAEGGSFNEKIEIRRVDPTDSSSYLGVFAKDDLDPQETLMEIPQSCYIHIFDEVEEAESEEEMKEAYEHNMCRLSNKLMEEMELGESSQYAPFIAYLKTQKIGQLPVNWSKEGKALLRQLLLPGSENTDGMVDWIDIHYEGRCINRDDEFESHMMEMTMQRGFDTALIPIWDMVNHDNGRINTENNSMYDEGGLKVQASRAIEAGEEIFASYDLCLDCNEIHIDEPDQGTSAIFREFGFIEGYPHRWYFDEEDIWMMVKEDGTDGPRVIFAPEGESDSLDSTDILYFQAELARLQDVGGRKLSKSTGSIPKNEWNMILSYYNATTTDLSLAIEQAILDLSMLSSNATTGDVNWTTEQANFNPTSNSI